MSRVIRIRAVANLLSSQRRREWLMFALLFVAVTVLHARGLRPGYAFLPIDNVDNNLPWRTGPFQLGHLQNPLIGDPIYQFYPLLINQVEAVRSGHWPLWTPRILLGHPLLGDPLAQTFYPVFLGLALVFGPARGLTYGFWLHALLAAGLTYAWLRSAGIGQVGAFVGALAYVLGGSMLTWFETTFWVSTLSWLPGVLWMYERAVRRHSLANTAAGGLMLGLSALAGQISFVVAFGAFLSLYGAGHILEAWRRRHRFEAWPLVTLGIILTIGVLLASAQILPFMEALAQSHRAGGVPFAPLPWQQAITWLVPNFYGNPTTTRAYWGAINYAEAVGYTGATTILLAGLGVFSSRRFWPVYLACLSLAVAYLIYGGPGSGWLASLPLVSYVTFSRLLFLLPLLVAYLAGTAIDTVRIGIPMTLAVAGGLAALVAWAWIGNWGGAQTHAAELRGPIFWAAGLMAAAIMLLSARQAWPSGRIWLEWLLAGLVFVDLFAFGSRFNPALPIASLPQTTPALAFLQQQAAPYRVATIGQEGEIVFGPNYLSVFGIDDLSGYSSLLPRSLVELVAAGDPRSGGYNANAVSLGAPSLRLLDLLQAGLVVSVAPRMDTGPRAEHLGACAGQTHELNSDQPLTGTVAVRSTAINRLDLTFRTVPGSQPAGALAVRMWQGPNRARLVLEGQADLSPGADRQMLTFYFAPETDAPGHVYDWELTTATSHTGFALCSEANGEPSVSLFGADWQVAYHDELTITERLGRLPRAYVDYSAETMADEASAIHRALDESFDIRNTAILSQDLGLPQHTDVPASPAEMTSYGDTDVTVRVNALRRGVLVLGDQAYPGWQAWVDGRPTDVLTANIIWRGVLLQPGEHQVEFKFAPLSLKLGIALTGVGLMLAAGLWVLGRQGRPIA